MTSALRPGVRVGRARHFLGTWDPRAALRSSVGIERNGDAFVPRDEWYVLDDAAAALLVAPTDDPAPDIAVFTTPAWVRADFWALDLERVLAPPAVAPAEPTEFVRYSARVVDFLRFIDVPLGASASVRVTATAAGKSVLDAIPRGGLRMPARRANGSTALINVGEATRSLVFLNIASFGHGESDGAAQAFMAGHMDYPVARLMLAPGQGCFGVLDAMAHASHVVDMDAPDVCLEVAATEAG